MAEEMKLINEKQLRSIRSIAFLQEAKTTASAEGLRRCVSRALTAKLGPSIK
jgi:hypothetical protein